MGKGNGGWSSSFDIPAPSEGRTGYIEVQVSAIDGSIVSVEKENAASEAKEKKQDSGKFHSYLARCHKVIR